MSDQPQCYSSELRKARKIHKCCECGTTIEKNEKYHYFSGIWDGEAHSFKTCQKCELLREDFLSDQSIYDDGIQFGGLEDYLGNEFDNPDNPDDIPDDVKEMFERCNSSRENASKEKRKKEKSQTVD